MKMKKGLKYIWITILLFSLIVPMFNSQAKAAEQMNPKHEMRAAWIATVQNIDIRSGMNETAYTAWVVETLDFLKGKNFNAIIYQVKPTSDTFYPSNIDPWSKYITGKSQDTDPGYDPLAIMIEEAHNRGIEVHAWVNPYRITMPGETLESLADKNVAKKNPEWVVYHGRQYYLNPGIPEVRDYLISVVEELVENYDIEAVHMDDYFYPYRIAGQEFPDEEQYELYGEGFDHIDDWRRDNVNRLVADLNNAIKNKKEWVQFGISPFGVWRNIANDPTGSRTTAGQTNYDDLYADTRQWIKDGSIDYITPQIYWSRGFAAADYTILLDWWSNEVNTYAYNTPVNLYIGTADYKVADNFDQNWYNPYELAGQILDNRANGTALGQMHFSLRQIIKNNIGYANILENEIYTTKAITPATPWNNDSLPQKPNTVHAHKEDGQITLTIDDKKHSDARRYVIYRFEGNKEGDYNNPANIVDVIYTKDGVTTFTDTTIEDGKSYTYGVTSLSNTGVESKHARAVRVLNQ
ncbi:MULTISPECIES: glycoside hydrolase family 10 protein [Sutcliffiella]|uniref:glycoside hydrolase family 10 protein n=1 Tax=Sutcliffiella TaxID=2837511 RepID=UPI0022DD5C3A|nr:MULTISPECIES: family 10 glycosylhydrolase [Sutcliffiella]MED4017916.1 family 10 glycosylhydrolase [Sutcliffiella cohnii]WBL16582.1 family 10 glycosylhydrolase [Sutcliffiella sp. NC1]